MRVNRWIYGENTFKQEKEKICRKINSHLPENEKINANSRFIHKIMSDKKVGSLLNLTTTTNRSTSKTHHRYPKKKLHRTSFEYHIQLYNQIQPELKKLRPVTFKKKLRKTCIEFTPED